MSIDTQEHEFPPLCTISTQFGLNSCFCCCFSSSGSHAAAGPSGLCRDSLWVCTCLAQHKGQGCAAVGRQHQPKPTHLKGFLRNYSLRGEGLLSQGNRYCVCSTVTSPATAAYVGSILRFPFFTSHLALYFLEGYSKHILFLPTSSHTAVQIKKRQLQSYPSGTMHLMYRIKYSRGFHSGNGFQNG